MQRLAESLDDQGLSQRQLIKKTNKCLNTAMDDMQCILDRLDRDIPLLQLAISASGETLSGSMPACVSPSRLLQASTLLTIADTRFSANTNMPVEIGPTFILSVYMLFSAYCNTSDQFTETSAEGVGRLPVWQEVIHKAKVTIRRIPLQIDTKTCDSGVEENSTTESAYSYALRLVEDLDDGRVHEGVAQGTELKETIVVGEIIKLFYTNSGKILNITDRPGSSEPVLLLKRDVSGACKSRHQSTSSNHGFPLHLDPEWIALQVHDRGYGSDAESSHASL